MADRAASVFAADWKVGADLARVDWSATPLGPPDRWPVSLQTAVSILLASKFPMWMAWGEDLTFFCNDAYRRDTLGQKYPWALGRPSHEVWEEIWDAIGPRIQTVLATGEATWDEALLLFLERSGYPEESYHTFSYSPMRDDDGRIVGMLCVVSEDTERVIGDRRMATLRDLGSDPSVLRTEREMLDFAVTQLGRNPYDLPFTLTYLYQEGGGARLAAATGFPGGHPAAVDFLDPGGATVWPIEMPLRGESAVMPLDGAVFADLPPGPWAAAPAQAMVVPLRQQGGQPYGFLVAALNRYRAMDEGYGAFVELVAGYIAAGIGSARSYGAQQRRAEELMELDRAKTTFFSNISHEFRTPLTLIMGPVQELQNRLSDADPRVREELEAIRRNGMRLGKLVNNLLDFSRIEAGRMRAVYERVDLAVVTRELASVFRSAVVKAGLDFEVDCQTLPSAVYVDRDMWEKVVLNLLSNALKFTFEGSIRVTTRAVDGQAQVEVADTGIGVADEEMPRLFERFHRIESARSRSNEGSGIGLALAKELIALHGGVITATSAVGEGTCLTIRLPFGSAHLPSDAVFSEPGVDSAPTGADPFLQEALRWLPSAGESAGGGAGAAVGRGEQAPEPVAGPRRAGPADAGRVLVADDNADMRDYLTRLLRGAGYEVTVVADGRQALESVTADVPDLIISDVMMPDLDGLALVAALRGDPRTASIPVLLLSARAGQEASIEGLRAGADDYLVKPFAAAELLARVRANIELSQLRSHHIRWRNALVDSLQEAFFICEQDGTVVETNAAFGGILGYGPEGLPYRPAHPWWPEAATEPEAHRRVAEAFTALPGRDRGTQTVPVTHREGHRLWISIASDRVRDPDSDRTVIVGTFRDVTAEYYAVQRETALAALAGCLARATSLPEALTGALEELKNLWHARRVVAAVFGSGDEPVLTTTDPALAWPQLAAERRRALADLRQQPALTTVADEAGASVLLEHPDGPLVLGIELGEQRPLSVEDLLLLSLLGSHLAQGLARVHQIEQQRETAIALQRAILGPSSLPEGFAVRYEPATRPLEVGGDWYDTVRLADGRIGIVVGDCVGRGLSAASVMGQMRSACRALLLQDASPARVLTVLDQFALDVPGAVCTTVFCGVLDPETGNLTYSSAGHPPGILVHSDGGTHLLEEGRALPLAVRPEHPRPESICAIPARSTLLLYTDGLVERRRRSLSAGIDQAGAVVRAGRDAAVEDLATDVINSLAPAGGYDDDVALLLYRHPAPLQISFAAESSQLAPVRQALRGWLDQCDLPPGTVQNVLVAVGEACANAIEHGHREVRGEVVLFRAEAGVDSLHLTITDSGSWKPPEIQSGTDRGRGLTLMHALMNQVVVTPGPTGTTVRMHKRIGL
ncbi:SpoIIE family protein phosphatase [Catenulispora sp. NF23]|uniref:histidine kinase n=1 Tax=Catenulispora pinistramenti TaxID=2705254 RepID=A0ABS5KNG0_9ACTN|nr:SpoIIE family protein phosphatase [Catenulispora pinistramenti]MBS2547594.1 SpoIIE family protein phosphatase [Catenulispora pinistramenti]